MKQSPRPLGVSVVICAHNSAARILPTLAHLKLQDVGQFPWEVLLVDNASNDGTAEMASRYWADAAVPLRVTREPQLGQAYARRRGFAEARYEFVSFIDDDNWVCRDWVARTAEVMNSRPSVGACGGVSAPVYEVPTQPFFGAFERRLAVGDLGKQALDVTETVGLLWGAGLTVRLSAWEQVSAGGLTLQATGRRGAELASCDDAELCLALRVAGWRLWYEPSLCLKHFIPRQRVTWRYLRGVANGSGRSTPALDGYYVALRQGAYWRWSDFIRWSWQWQAFRALRVLLCRPVKVLRSTLFFEPMWDPEVLTLEESKGRLAALWRMGREYGRGVKSTAALAARLGPR